MFKRITIITSVLMALGASAFGINALASTPVPQAENVSPWICETNTGQVFGFGHSLCPAAPGSRIITFTPALVSTMDIKTGNGGWESVTLTYTDGQTSSLMCTNTGTPVEVSCK